jgi:hypothetical protein
MNMNKLLAPLGVALLAVMIPAQGERAHIEDHRTA